ncbi:F-box only protein 15-like isoform X2 [Cebidichthys violaceus]|uniref:F-box only protein 15-like isoform X2 n=1 Tax=Cebidichthys violaceus TaxID=271503 RepID=UPI0035CBF61F
MAAGRGAFLTSYLEGLRRNSNVNCGHTAPARPHTFRKPGPDRRASGPGSNGQTDGKGRKNQPTAAPCSFSGNGRRWPETRIQEYNADFPQMVISQSEENVMERLPPEILLKILSYLDASSLSCISHVCKIFHQLADDNVIWHEIYMSDFGNPTWRTKPAAGDAALEVDSVPVERWSAGHWKKMYFRVVTGQDVNKWRRELRDVCPNTGLPRRTEWVLRNLNVSWELTVCGSSGQEITMEPSGALFFKSSAIVNFSGERFLEYHQIRNIQLYGVRKETLKSPKARRPGWRSLILKLEPRTCVCWCFGSDSLIRLRHLQPGVTIGTWRGDDTVAFIMVTLHFHKLVEKCLLGSPVCPYSEPVDLPPVDNSDPELGLHGYSLHFVLHNTGTEIMSGNFRQLCCRTVQIQDGLVVLRAINLNNFSQHRPLSGNIKLPWKSNSLKGSVEKPFWCVSSSIFTVRTKWPLAVDYGDEHFLMNFHNPEGRVKMKLVWLEEKKQFFVVGLVVYVPVVKVNKRFSRAY